MSDWTREEWIAGARAEIEREGIHVEISDDELWEAMISPLREQMRRYRQVEARLGEAAEKTAEALRRFVEAIERGEAMDDMRVDIEDLPTTDPGDDR